jgi:hypothetical protein|nr:MAG TPA: hypothetical protein [Caudoviricetes sp.]
MAKIKISGSEPVKYGPHDFQLGDYVYAPVSLNDPSKGNQLACISNQDKDGCTLFFVKAYRKVYREYKMLYLVPITEEWLKENPQVFAPSDDMKPLEATLHFLISINSLPSVLAVNIVSWFTNCIMRSKRNISAFVVKVSLILPVSMNRKERLR